MAVERAYAHNLVPDDEMGASRSRSVSSPFEPPPRGQFHTILYPPCCSTPFFYWHAYVLPRGSLVLPDLCCLKSWKEPLSQCWHHACVHVMVAVLGSSIFISSSLRRSKFLIQHLIGREHRHDCNNDTVMICSPTRDMLRVPQSRDAPLVKACHT